MEKNAVLKKLLPEEKARSRLLEEKLIAVGRKYPNHSSLALEFFLLI